MSFEVSIVYRPSTGALAVSKDLDLGIPPMKKIFLLMALAAVLLFGGVVIFLRTGGPSDAASLASADSILFVNIPNTPRSAIRWGNTALAKIGREPEMKAFLEMPLANVQALPGSKEAQELLISLKPATLFLSITKDASDQASALLGFQFWGARGNFDESVGRLRSQIPTSKPAELRETHNGCAILESQHGDRSLFSGCAGRWGFLSTNLTELKAALDRVAKQGANPLDQNPRFTKACSELLSTPDLLVFIQPERAIDSLLAAGQALGADPIPAQVDQLKSIQAIGATLKLDGPLQRDAIFILRKQSPPITRSLTHEAMKLTTAKTTLFLDFALNFEALPGWVESMVGENQKTAAIAKPLAEAAAASFAPDCAVMANWTEGSMAPSPILSVLIKNGDRARETLSQVIPLAPGATFQKIDGIDLYTIPTQYGTLTVAQNDLFMLAGIDPALVTQAAKGATGEKTLVESAPFLPALGIYESANEGFCYIDTGTVFERLYSSFVPVLRFGALVMPSIGKMMDINKLPKAETISRHLPPIVLSQKRTSEGTLIESSGPVSMSEFLLIGAGAFGATKWPFFQ